MDLTDRVSEEHVTDLSSGRRPSTPGVEAQLRRAERPGGDLDRQSLLGHHRDGLEPPFGGTTFPSSSVARRCTASSAWSSAIRRLAAVSSAFSALVSARRQSLVDPVLTTPGVDRLGADVEVARDVGDGASGLDQVQHLGPELRRATTSSHKALLQGSSGSRIPEPDSTERGTHQSLHQTGATHSRPRSEAAPEAGLARQVLLGLMASRTQVRRVGVNLNQGVAALHATGGRPVWLADAAATARRAVVHLDETASAVASMGISGRHGR